MFKDILLCTHGSEGSKRAEKFVFDKLLASTPNLQTTVLTVIDEDWREMTGDDWLNSSKTHEVFLDHVEKQLGIEIEEDWQRIKKSFPNATDVEFIKFVGCIEETITKIAKKKKCDLMVIGPYRDTNRLFTWKMENGLRARMKNSVLHPILPCPIMVVP